MHQKFLNFDQKTIQRLLDLSNSDSPTDRKLSASYGFALDKLFTDTDSSVRFEVAKIDTDIQRLTALSEDLDLKTKAAAKENLRKINDALLRSQSNHKCDDNPTRRMGYQ